MKYIDNGKYQIISAVYHMGKNAKSYDFIALVSFPEDAKIGLVETGRALKIPLDTVWLRDRGLKPRDIEYARMVQAADKKPEEWT